MPYPPDKVIQPLNNWGLQCKAYSMPLRMHILKLLSEQLFCSHVACSRHSDSGERREEKRANPVSPRFFARFSSRLSPPSERLEQASSHEGLKPKAKTFLCPFKFRSIIYLINPGDTTRFLLQSLTP